MKSLKTGWIVLSAFVEKYFEDLTPDQKTTKHANLRKLIKDFPDKHKDLVGRTRTVNEKEFCEFINITHR